jgi:hypothetical protein
LVLFTVVLGFIWGCFRVSLGLVMVDLGLGFIEAGSYSGSFKVLRLVKVEPFTVRNNANYREQKDSKGDFGTV